jgi:hypothetical protein
MSQAKKITTTQQPTALPRLHLPRILATIALSLCATMAVNPVKEAVLEHKLEKFRPDIIALAHVLPAQCEVDAIVAELRHFDLNTPMDLINRTLVICDLINTMPTTSPETARLKRVMVTEFGYIQRAAQATRQLIKDFDMGNGLTASSAIVDLYLHSDELLENVRAIDDWYEAYIYKKIEEEFDAGMLSSNPENGVYLAQMMKGKLLEIAREVPTFDNSGTCLYNKLEEIELQIFMIATGSDFKNRLPAAVKVIAWRNDSPINLRARMSTKAKVLGQIAIGDQLTLVEVNSNWSKVTHPRLGTGWIKNGVLHTDECVEKPTYWLWALCLAPLIYLVLTVIARFRGK